MVIRGRVLELWRWPVKSMGGEQVPALQVDWRGAAGDRTHALHTQRRGALKQVTARESRALLGWRATYPVPGADLAPDDPPVAYVHGPDGRTLRWDDPALRPALEADLGLPLTLRRDVEGQQDLGRSLLITTRASHAALEGELGVPLDMRRFRTNLHLDLDCDPWAELGWEGGRVALPGGVTLELLHPCVRCAIPTRDPDTGEKMPALLRHLAREHATMFGINARVVTGGRIDAGAAVQVSPPPAGPAA